MKVLMDNYGKRAVGEKAADAISDGMVVGLGTGSTVAYFLTSLAKKIESGLKITAVASSKKTENIALELKIPLIDNQEITHIDITVDGADQITSDKMMIKGGGGALLREKIVATSSKELLVIVDETKVSENLGNIILPIEIEPFAYLSTLYKINAHGFKGELRIDGNTPYLSDGGHLIYDITLNEILEDPLKTHQKLIGIPGVIETGLFFNIAGRVLIGKGNGEVEIWQ
ncbi:MAG: ribose-5-phosphate isomerase RpiA [Simkaniaceae bacterium]